MDADKTACTEVLSRTLKGFHAGGAHRPAAGLAHWVLGGGGEAQWSRVDFNCGLDAALVWTKAVSDETVKAPLRLDNTVNASRDAWRAERRCRDNDVSHGEARG